MAIKNNIASLLGRLAQQPMTDTAKKPSLPALNSEGSNRLPVGKNSFSGSGLSLELSLSSGQEVEVSIRINQAGGLSELSLVSDSKLTVLEQEKLASFLEQLSYSVADLFKGEGGSDSFSFANQKGIEDIELNAYQDNSSEKQTLFFDKEGRGSGRKIEAAWSEYDRANGIEENHDFTLTKQAKKGDQSAVYGSVNFQWLLDQVDSAMSGIDDKHQAKKLANFFNSGIRALFSNASSGSALLQQLGASSEEAKTFIGRSIKVLASDYVGQSAGGNITGSQATNQQRQMNGLPDFNMLFSSERKVLGVGEAYQFDMKISQNTDQAISHEDDKSYQTQNRRLQMGYQSARQQAIYEYTWTRDESLRNVFESGSLAATHYRLNERIQSREFGDVGSAKATEIKDRRDIDLI